MFQVTFATLLGTVPLLQPAAIDPNPASLVVSEEDTEVARGLVKALADPYFNAREEAYRELREMGRFALPAIREGIEQSTVPEVIRRCELLYPRAFNLETLARVECFAADTENKYQHDLPGAEQFFAITGRTDQARDLYRDLILSPNRELLIAIGQSEEVAATAAANRRIQLDPRANRLLNGRTAQPEAEDVVALLLVETTIPDRGGGVGINSPTYLLTSSKLRTALTSDPRKEALQAITVKWFETRTSPTSVVACMSAASSLNLPVALPLARKMLTLESATANQKAQAASKVAQQGTAADLPLLAPLLQDEGVAYNGTVIVNGDRSRVVIQVRDVALAMSHLIAKKDPTDAGMKSRYPNNTSESLKYSYYNYHFPDEEAADDARDKAIAEWYEWAGKNVKEYPKAPAPKDKK